MYIAKFSVTLLTLFLSFAAAATQDGLLERLKADHEALIAVEADYRRQRAQGTLGAAEAADYANYVARLRERFSQDCLLLARADIRPPDEFPCPSVQLSTVRSAPIDQRGEQSRAEKKASMDAELNASLGEFDEMLLREQERVKAEMPKSDAGADGGAGRGEGGGGEGGEQGEGDAGAEGAQAGDRGEGSEATDSGDRSGGSRVGGQPPSGAAGGREKGSQTGARGEPEDIPDGSDDEQYS